MSILLLFNSNNRILVNVILDTTGIPSEIFMPTLLSLLKIKVLCCPELDSDKLKNLQTSDISMNYTIEVNERFRLKKSHFKYLINKMSRFQ